MLTVDTPFAPQRGRRMTLQRCSDAATGCVITQNGDVVSERTGRVLAKVENSADGGCIKPEGELENTASRRYNENIDNYLAQLSKMGVKYDSENVVSIIKLSDGRLIWLETGNEKAGLNHIVAAHANDFARKGITREQIPTVIMLALSEGNIVGYQGRGLGRPIYEVTLDGRTHRIAITVGSNGFVIGANPK